MRLVRDDGLVLIDADADRGTDLVHQVGTLFFGPDGAPTLRELDETLGPVTKRAEVVSVTGWPPGEAPPPPPEGSAHQYPLLPSTAAVQGAAAPVSTAFREQAPAPPDATDTVVSGCRTSPAGKLLVYHTARTVNVDGHTHVVYAQESSRRAVRVLYDLRYHLARLTIVMLPLALAFSWWMGRRMVHPIEWLRERVPEKAKSANPRPDIDLRGGEEVRDLAEAFNEFKNPVAAIGLALVKAIAEAHGGSVSARSSPGEGATFRVTLPARRA